MGIYDIIMTSWSGATGVPTLKQLAFHRCPSCWINIKKDTGASIKYNRVKQQLVEKCIRPGQHLHMDFSFFRGSAFKDNDDQGHLITSIDGFRSYLIIFDWVTRYKCLFLTSTKHPPIQEVYSIIKKFHPSLHGLHTAIHTDQCGELENLHKFRDLLKKYEYSYEPTGTNSSKNGIAEKPNQDLKRIARSLIYAASLLLTYWGYALNHTLFLTNRRYHSTINMTLYQALRHI